MKESAESGRIGNACQPDRRFRWRRAVSQVRLPIWRHGGAASR
jgi:hypothetical protein